MRGREFLYFYRSGSENETATWCDLFDHGRIMKYAKELPDIPATEGLFFIYPEFDIVKRPCVS